MKKNVWLMEFRSPWSDVRSLFFLGLLNEDMELGIQGSGFRVQGSGFRIQDSGFRNI
jgi:hypothetical protein